MGPSVDTNGCPVTCVHDAGALLAPGGGVKNLGTDVNIRYWRTRIFAVCQRNRQARYKLRQTGYAKTLQGCAAPATASHLRQVCLDRITRADCPAWFDHCSRTSPGTFDILGQIVGAAVRSEHIARDCRASARHTDICVGAGIFACGPGYLRGGWLPRPFLRAWWFSKAGWMSGSHGLSRDLRCSR